MKLVLLRHGIAEDVAPGGDDGARPLTHAGREKLEQGALGLSWALDTVEVWASSPLVRAVETARLVAAAFGEREPEELELEELEELLPEARPDALLPWLRRQPKSATVLLAGHAPHLSAIAAFLLGAPDPPFALKKGGACLLELDGAPGPGAARLVWLLTAGQLRRLGGE